MFASLAPEARATPQEDALKVVEKWAQAFTDSDLNAIVDLYAPDSLFLGTTSKSVVTDLAGIRAYFEPGLLNNRPRGARLNQFETMAVSDTVVVVTGLDTITGVRDGTPTIANGRVTFVVAKRGTAWKIVHFHRSALPGG